MKRGVFCCNNLILWNKLKHFAQKNNYRYWFSVLCVTYKYIVPQHSRSQGHKESKKYVSSTLALFVSMWNVNNNMAARVPVREGDTEPNTITHDFRLTGRVVECDKCTKCRE
jgi:hypothetical protein